MSDLAINAAGTMVPPRGRSSRGSFAAAQRHSRLVRFLKRAIPLGSGLAIVSIVLIGIFDPFRTIGAISIGPVNLTGTRITMDQPRLTGFRAKDAKPYEVTAESATQDIRKPTVVEMTKLRARVELANNETVRLEADTGIYDTQNEQIDLKSNVRVITTGGYNAALRSAFVDFKAGSVTSREPVSVAFRNGVIDAAALDVTDGGQRMVFHGRVHATFDLPDSNAAGARSGASPGAAPVQGAKP